MQQTQTYKLNLIETSDTFSPAPLNENMEKLEAAIAAGTSAGASADAALDQRVTVLEGLKIAFGTYTGDGANDGQFINLGFTPSAVLISDQTNTVLALNNVPTRHICIEAGGFRPKNNTYRFNDANRAYSFIAIP